MLDPEGCRQSVSLRWDWATWPDNAGEGVYMSDKRAFVIHCNAKHLREPIGLFMATFIPIVNKIPNPVP